MTADNFLTLLQAYLSSTFISFGNHRYVQRKRICIGSCLALILCNIFLAQIDQALECVFSPHLVTKVFRYVDNFLIVCSKQSSVTHPNLVKLVLDDFGCLGIGLTFTHEVLHKNSIQFLDLSMKVLQGHVCWAYSPRSRKELLPYDSAHFELFKRAIASLCLESALRKSCAHMMQDSFEIRCSDYCRLASLFRL